ncbi:MULTISPECIES: zinc ribbon domain-containing protein [Paenibacillus]|uniref:zinc ribbon domain-containing protein n=1 Tax=Paenibacillus TaxID=44249 RepID=UPI00087FED74|nr:MULTISPECIES: zinc ribbon domain-containing protein [Paenibacillus]NTZ17473.1 zinc ribbon domain-containing protein [Paenibacillus sp. JMULE4]GCL72010.1 zinc ribbon domain-containing protein [Paenibacillus naphthalenovorans]SDI45177.1 hypothetical protein SAMN05421868_106193 [Paenibacillus naphthalenovorans]
MNHFLSKLKKGASRAADKAQQAIEVTKITAQIHSKRKQLDQNLYQIGLEVYEAYKAADLSKAEKTVRMYSKENQSLELQIRQLEDQIRLLKHEKQCACGQSVKEETRFCPNCGARLEASEEPYLPQIKRTPLPYVPDRPENKSESIRQDVTPRKEPPK